MKANIVVRLVALAAGLMAGSSACALDPSRAVSQYGHSFWSRDQGVPASISAAAQDANGFLWLAARDGLYRFDGLTFQRVVPRAPAATDRAYKLMPASDGSLWIGYSAGRIARYAHGRLTFFDTPDLGRPILRIAQTRDGSVWAAVGGSYGDTLLRLVGRRFLAVGKAMGVPPDQAIDMQAMRDGSLWLTLGITGGYRLAPHGRRFEKVAVPVEGNIAVSEDERGAIWFSDKLGSRVVWREGRFVAGEQRFPTPGFQRAVKAFWDRDGNLWGELFKQGVFRLSNPYRRRGVAYETPPGSVEIYDAAHGLSSNLVSGAIQDREGNIWIASTSSLDRLWDTPVVAEPTLTSAALYGDILTTATDGSVYVVEQKGVYRIAPGASPVLVLPHKDAPTTMCRGADNSVLVEFPEGLVRLNGAHARWIKHPPGLEWEVFDCVERKNRDLWLSAGGAGLFRLRDGAWRAYLTPKYEGALHTKDMVIADDRRLVVNRTERLTVLQPSRVSEAPIGTTRAIDQISVLLPSRTGVLIGGPFGIGRLRSDRLAIVPTTAGSPARNVTSMVQTPAGDTWLQARAGLVRVATRDLEASLDQGRDLLRPFILDRSDGVDEDMVSDAHLSSALGGDGRLWFSAAAGTRWLNPGRIPFNAVPPGVAVTRVGANGESALDPDEVSLRPGTSAVEIGFAALSLSKPNRLKVRYRLEGVDEGWIDPGTRRTAFYTNLGPGDYVFEVRAANENGIWSRQVGHVTLHIPPTFLQSVWFKSLLGLLALLIAVAAYRLRVKAISDRMQMRMDDRMAERERIARDLHDTALQGFQAMILRIHALNRTNADVTRKDQMEAALQVAEDQLEQGRRELHRLRSDAHYQSLIAALRNEAARLNEACASQFGISEHGTPRSLHPLIATESERIAVEAMRNAATHARAARIDVEIDYARGGLEVTVRDDGAGIPPEVLAAGRRDGHYGLPGMRERAERAKGHLEVRSGVGTGTVIRLFVPARFAYQGKR